ncbi:molybdopterin molybdenumtransferase MoeA, partial [Nesterenkonia alkaliphila]
VERTAEGFTVLEAPGRGEPAQVRFTDLTAEDLQPGRFIRRAGSDVAAGETVLRPGDALTPARLGLLAACGAAEVRVLEPVLTLVLATGEEIRGPGEPLGPGQLYDANSVLISAACEDFGHQVISARVPSDSPDRFDAALEALIAQHRPHLIITAGGISAGAYEVVRQALGSRGVQFGSVAQQPGGPQGWGSLSAEHGPVAVIALPGNPVSCAVSLEVLLRPALASLDPGCPDQRRVPVRLAEPLVSPRGLRQFRRVQLAAGQAAVLPAAVPVGGPSSHLLGHLARSDALLEIPEDMVEIPAGTPLEAILL